MCIPLESILKNISHSIAVLIVMLISQISFAADEAGMYVGLKGGGARFSSSFSSLSGASAQDDAVYIAFSIGSGVRAGPFSFEIEPTLLNADIAFISTGLKWEL